MIGTMTLPRSTLIDPERTPYCHCVSRCVRRAYLCGVDKLTGKNFDHRKSWLERRMMKLASVFAIDLCAYSIMSNHYHVLLHINTEAQARLSAEEVVERWTQLFRNTDWLKSAGEHEVARTVEVWRERLGSISWFMRCLNEPLARLANKEDGCKGRFWEGRFQSRAVLDDCGLLRCMTYVDLNPVRAQVADLPENSDYTSLQARLDGRDAFLAPMAGAQVNGFRLPIGIIDYLKLVDWTSRQIRADKPGGVPASTPGILKRISAINARHWAEAVLNVSRRYHRAIGSDRSLRAYRDHLGQQRLNGLAMRPT